MPNYNNFFSTTNRKHDNNIRMLGYDANFRPYEKLAQNLNHLSVLDIDLPEFKTNFIYSKNNEQ